jgi:hypothetical protein
MQWRYDAWSLFHIHDDIQFRVTVETEMKE